MSGAFPRKQPVKKAGADAPAFSTVKEASQSLRSQAQRKWKSFSPAACTSEKIPLGSQTCERKRVRCREPQPFQTRAQRSGSHLRACQKYFFDTLKPALRIVSEEPVFSCAASVQVFRVHALGGELAEHGGGRGAVLAVCHAEPRLLGRAGVDVHRTLAEHVADHRRQQALAF